MDRLEEIERRMHFRMHFRVPGPVSINFSGGRTSTFMLWLVLDAYDGKLPEDVVPIFCNTGKEHPKTLDFVQNCSERWGVPIVWLEYDRAAPHRTKVVNYDSASRNGEPFEALINDKQMLPNPVTRFCTVELKIRRAKFYMHKVRGFEHWVSLIGLRADEPHRVARLQNQKERFDSEAPLARAGLTKRDVGAFWAAQDFDLGLPNINNTTPHGNCDLCFLKGYHTIRALIRENPETAKWWIDMEARAPGKDKVGSEKVALFRIDRPRYAAILEDVKRSPQLDFGDEPSLDCWCTD